LKGKKVKRARKKKYRLDFECHFLFYDLVEGKTKRPSLLPLFASKKKHKLTETIPSHQTHS
jgi:hypothetical protein